MPEPFRLGITRDFLSPDGTLSLGDIGLDLLEQQTGVAWEFLAKDCDEIPPDVADRYDGLLVLKPRVTARTVSGCQRLKLVARFGVGYDNVDVEACSRSGVMLTITPDGVRRPVAVSALTFLLAVSHKLLIKDRLTRQGRWSEKLDHMGVGLTGRTLGVIGLGNIGKEIFRLAAPLEMRHVGHDPFVSPESVREIGVEWLELEDMLGQTDFVIVCCALTPSTFHLIDERRIGLMKPTAYLINVARGPIVDQAALTRALQAHAIAGAALDVFEQEPIDPNDPILQLENIIVAPHAICWTDELFRANGRSAFQSVLDFAEGNCPRYIVNREVLGHPRLAHKGWHQQPQGQPG